MSATYGRIAATMSTEVGALLERMTAEGLMEQVQ